MLELPGLLVMWLLTAQGRGGSWLGDFFSGEALPRNCSGSRGEVRVLHRMLTLEGSGGYPSPTGKRERYFSQ